MSGATAGTGTVAVFIYLALMMVIGASAATRIKSAADYIVAGRSMGFWFFVMLMLGATTSGMTLIGVAGLGFVGGWPTFWEQLFVPFACAFTIIVYGYKLHAVCREKHFMTIQDYLAYRYQSPVAVRAISSLAMLATSLIYLVGQYTAVAIVLKWLLGVGEAQALFIGAFIVVVYVLLGGLYAVAWTTLVQGIIIVAGVLVVAPAVIQSAGGPALVNRTLAAIDPALLRPAFPQVHPPAADYAFCTPLFIVSFALLLGMGLGSSPHIAHNVLTVRDRRTFRWAPLAVFLLYLPIMYLVKMSGMAARALAANGQIAVSRPDDALLAAVRYALPQAAWPIFAIVVLAAVMSTTDRLLIVIGTSVGWDLYHQILDRHASTKTVTLASRIAVIVFGAISFIVATHPPRLLAFLIWSAIGVMLSTFVTPLLFGLYWRRANGPGAAAAMISGFAAAVLFGAFHRFVRPLPFHFSMASFLVSAAVMVAVSLATRPPSPQVIAETAAGPFVRMPARKETADGA